MSDAKLTRIEDKIDTVMKDIGAINVTLASQHTSLKDHIRRTELLEADIKPIKTHVAMVHGALKLVGLVALLAGIIEAATQVYNAGK